MSEEIEAALGDYEDDHAAEYMEEAIQAYQAEQDRKAYERLPAMCKRCRWLDMYMHNGCVHSRWPTFGPATLHPRVVKLIGRLGLWRAVNALWPQDGECTLYLYRFYFEHPRWLYLFLETIWEWLWNWRTRTELGKYSAPIGGEYLPDDKFGDEDVW